jgi:hypothetical protein
MEAWTFAASLFILILLGLWIYRHRSLDPWLLLGVSALVARLSIYHRWYDDLLILVPMLTLLRLIRTDAGRTAPAGWLFAGAVVTSLAPGGLFVLPPPWLGVYVIAQVGLWLTMLGYLGYLGKHPNVLRVTAEGEHRCSARGSYELSAPHGERCDQAGFKATVHEPEMLPNGPDAGVRKMV